MKNDWAKRPLEAFLEALGSGAPSPGGGSAAALTAALGAALIEMVVRINQKKTGARPASGDPAETAAKIRMQLATLISLDCDAFETLASFKGEAKKGADYQAALENAALVPFMICRYALEALSVGMEEITRTSEWLRSDLMEAGNLLETAFVSARATGEANMALLHNPEQAVQLRESLVAAQNSFTNFKTSVVRFGA